MKARTAKLSGTHRLRRCALVMAASLLGCGGTYSNEDIEFQTAAPEPESLQPQVGAQLVAGSAEYYRLTYGVVASYRSILSFVVTILDEVRRVPATTRTPGQRIWGPFPDDEDRRFVHRVVIRKEPVPLDVQGATTEEIRFAYSIETAPRDTPARSDAWARVVTGWFDPQGGVSQGRGQVVFDVDSLRVRRYRLSKDLDELRVITLDYDVKDTDRTLLVHQENLASADSPSADLTYRETADGSATTHFTLNINGTPSVEAFDVVSAWRADGAGRADLVISRGTGMGLKGTDCWNGLTLPTFVEREWEPEKNAGDPATCVLPPLR